MDCLTSDNSSIETRCSLIPLIAVLYFADKQQLLMEIITNSTKQTNKNHRGWWNGSVRIMIAEGREFGTRSGLRSKRTKIGWFGVNIQCTQVEINRCYGLLAH